LSAASAGHSELADRVTSLEGQSGGLAIDGSEIALGSDRKERHSVNLADLRKSRELHPSDDSTPAQQGLVSLERTLVRALVVAAIPFCVTPAKHGTEWNG